ncbi:MAG: thioesterase [Desulfobacterales bacterium]|nr:thioesterase [Desulfobacterales bacterium]
MKNKTHLEINEALCGTLTHQEENKSIIALTTTDAMRADERGLVHGGFLFGMADYAAMCAVNDPNVVLGSAETTFLKPVVVGETLTAEAHVKEEKGKKRSVRATITRNSEIVFEGNFLCFVLPTHVLGEKRSG